VVKKGLSDNLRVRPESVIERSATSGSIILVYTISVYNSLTEANQAALQLQTLSFNPYLGTFTVTSRVIYPTTPISPICFPAGTPIKTDQGLVPIEQIDTRRHTLYGQPILHITKTVTPDKYLIRFPKNVLERNIPSATTVMTKDHLIMFQEQLVPAYRFLEFSREIKKVTYSGEVLYNVLLAYHGTMEVNNMVCETLHPANKIAKLYMTAPASASQARK
jgi:hypothetical protein